MMYPFMTLNDDAEITHSQMRPDGSVKVFIETPDDRDGFHSAVCWLPEHRWEDVCGYSPLEMAYFRADLCLYSPESYTLEEKKEICNDMMSASKAVLDALGQNHI